MTIAQPCDSQMPGDGAKPPTGNTLDANLVVKTLNLHANAINTILCQVHALETHLRMRPEPPLPEPSEPSVTPSPSGTPDWLQAALGRREPEDGKPLIYFFHIPKTSGSSFIRFLMDSFGESNLSPLTSWDDVLAFSGTPGDWKVWHGHFAGMLPLILPSWPRMVTILRDPVDRALSHINHHRRAPYQLWRCAKKMSVLEFCRHPKLRREIDNAQARYLASLSFAQMLLRSNQHNGTAAAPVAFLEALFAMDSQYGLLDSANRALAEMDMVGIAEAHYESELLFAHKFDVPPPAQSYHVNKAEASQLKRADLSPKELECIQELTQIDQLVYDCARQRFERECRQAKLTLHFKEPEASTVAGAGIRYSKTLQSYWKNPAQRRVSSRAAALSRMSKMTEGQPESGISRFQMLGQPGAISE